MDVVSVDRSTWTDSDWQDVERYGLCWCGRPRRGHLERDASGTAYSWISCDVEAHGPDPRPFPLLG